MSQWQPIETAPKDGTEIDVWEFCHNPDWRPNRHGLASGYRVTNVRWTNGRWEYYFDRDGEWIEAPAEHYTISHWLAIPGPPR